MPDDVARALGGTAMLIVPYNADPRSLASDVAPGFAAAIRHSGTNPTGQHAERMMKTIRFSTCLVELLAPQPPKRKK